MMDNLEIPSGLKKRGEEEGTVASCYIDSINPFGYYILAPSVVVYERRRKKKPARPCSSSAIGHPQGRTPPCEKKIYEEEKKKKQRYILFFSICIYEWREEERTQTRTLLQGELTALVV